MRRSTRLPREVLAPYLFEPPDPPAPLAWPEVFGNPHPVEIEVGCGKGLFLLTAALGQPAVNFLGIEIERKYQLFTATRLAKRGLGNARVARADARAFLRDCVAPASVQAVHVYFPDPWWKKRHHKRRVFTADFVVQCERILVPGGRYHVATDVAEYFQIITDLVAQVPTLRRLPAPAEQPSASDPDYRTNFERKARQQGRSVHRVDYVKDAPTPPA